MKKHTIKLLSVLFLSSFVSFDAYAETYQFVNLESASNVFGVASNRIYPVKVSDNLQVTGTVRNENSLLRGFSWSNGVAVDLGTLGSTRSNINIVDTNNLGEITGNARNSSGVFKIFVWKNGTMSAYDYGGGGGVINNNSIYATPGALWKEGVVLSTLPQLTPGSPSTNGPRAINDSNEVVGTSFSATVGADVPALWRNGNVIQISNTTGRAVDINNQGQVIVDRDVNNGYVWKDGQIIKSFGYGSPISINNEGEVLVYFYGVGGTREGYALWNEVEGTRFLEDLIPDLPENFAFKNMNNRGDLIGQDAVTSFLLIKQIENSTPVINSLPLQVITEGQPLSFTVLATDPDNDTLTLSAANLPAGSTFNLTTGEFTWTPDFSDEGTYSVTFTATEDTAEALSATTSVIINVINFNRPPELSPIDNQTINEGGTLNFIVSATDPDNDMVTLSATNLPAGAPGPPSTGLFTWNTDFNDAGNYENIEFTVTDNGSPMELDVELITITVGDVNRLPELSNPGPQSVLEEETLSFTISATDPDNDTVMLTAQNLPTGAIFNGTMFSWTPTLAQAGVYTVSFTATDNGIPSESATTDVVITVGDNPTPTEQAEDLIETVVTIDIPQNVENSYLANLQKVGQFIQEGKITAALNQLNAFLNKITQDYNQGILTQTEYDLLREAAENLIGDLN